MILEGMRTLGISSPQQLPQSLFGGLQAPPSPTSSDQVVCVYDLETTGLGKTENIGIVEVGALALVYTKAGTWVEIDSFHGLWWERSFFLFSSFFLCLVFSFILSSVPEKEISPGVPHPHTRKLLKAKGKVPFSSDVGPKFKQFLEKNNVKILAAHNGKRYDNRILCFHGFCPPKGTLVGDTIVRLF